MCGVCGVCGVCVCTPNDRPTAASPALLQQRANQAPLSRLLSTLHAGLTVHVYRALVRYLMLVGWLGFAYMLGGYKYGKAGLTTDE